MEITEEQLMTDSDTTYICTACGWVYDPQQGDPDGGIPPGTPWEEIPDDWICPVCGAGKEDFEPQQPTPAPGVAASAEPAAADRTASPSLVIVGSGLAGYTLARELHAQGAGPLTLITADGGEAYTKPMLSNAFARHHATEDMVQKDAETLAKELGARILTRTRITAIDRQNHSLALESAAGAQQMDYERLVLALGADPRIFPAEGSEQVEISSVNDLDDYRRWRERIGSGGRILLIGAGLIGCEFANDLAAAGFEVALVDPSPWPLARLLPERIGRMLTAALEEIGCELHLQRRVTRYLRDDGDYIAELEDASRIPFEHALSAVGLGPRIALAQAAGLEVQTGILVDRLLRTSDPDIFALGDCAQTEAGILPFIAPLLAQARALAATLSGRDTPLHLPALPVVVKTPALPLVICPPAAGSEGDWLVDVDGEGAQALFHDLEGREIGFVLAGHKTALQRDLASRMPDLLPPADPPPVPEAAIEPASDGSNGPSFECNTCGYVYDPELGDPDAGIAPGTPWEALPDDWICPTCGAGKEEFSELAATAA